MDTPYNKPNRWSYFNKHYPELTYSIYIFLFYKSRQTTNKQYFTIYIRPVLFIFGFIRKI